MRVAFHKILAAKFNKTKGKLSLEAGVTRYARCLQRYKLKLEI